MPNIDNLIDPITQNFELDSSHTAYFSTLYLQYSYSQLILHPDTARLCDFNIISFDSTGTYRFENTFYDLIPICLLNFKKRWSIR